MTLTNGILFKALFENSINGCAHCRCVYDNNDKLIDYYHLLVNKAFEEITHLNAYQRYISELVPNLQSTNPDLFSIYDRVSKKGQPEVFEQYIPQAKVWFNISVYCLEEGTFTVVFNDISAQKNEQRLLLETKQRIETAYKETINGFMSTLRLRDLSTEEHSQRVVELTGRLAEKLEVTPEDVQQMKQGALLHDIGKMGITDAILQKPTALTEEEILVMKKHPIYAYNLLKPIEFISKLAIQIPHYHHERWNGRGYPEGLKGLDIPLSARIFAVVDVWDALTSDRPYRGRYSNSFTLQYIENVAGELFDPTIVKAFLEMMET